MKGRWKPVLATMMNCRPRGQTRVISHVTVVPWRPWAQLCGVGAGGSVEDSRKFLEEVEFEWSAEVYQ